MPNLDSFRPAPSLDDAHTRLAAHFGIELSYQTIWGEVRHATPSTVASIATAMAANCQPPLQWHDLSSCNAFLAQLWQNSWLQLAPPSLIEELSHPLENLVLHLNPQELSAPLSLLFLWEGGAQTLLSILPSALLPTATTTLGGQTYTRLSIPPNLSLPPTFPPGYHQLQIRTLHRQSTVSLTLCPSTVYRTPTGENNPQFTGVSCFLSAIRSQRNWGCGDFTDLSNWGRLAHTQGGFDFLALNPLHAISNRTPYNSSPYLPLSIFNRNFLYLDLESIPEFSADTPQRQFQSPAVQQLLLSLRSSPNLAIEQVARLKHFFLLLIYREFRRRGRPGLDLYRAQQGPSLLHFATYCAFDAYFHKRNPNCWHWRDWPLEYQQFSSPSSQALAQRLAHNIDFYCYVQFAIDTQLAAVQGNLRQSGMRLGLYHDLALATDRCGADLWAYQHLYVPAVRVGSPPDDFNEEGQDWGFPALSPALQLATGYDYFVRALRRAGQHGAALRFDHVMRLARLYWIPDGVSAKDGAYVRDHFLPMLRLIALESHRGRFEVVGEDLGTVPDYFRACLESFQLLSYKLVYFERFNSSFLPPTAYSPNALCSITTHDLPTLDGFWQHRDIDVRTHLGYLSPAQLPPLLAQRESDKLALKTLFENFGPFQLDENQLDGAFSFLRSTPCRMILINTEELFAETEQQNFPGTTAEQPNWLRRWPTNLELLSKNEVFQARLASWCRSVKVNAPQ
jgi:4-alpha-glucanotransferase